MSSPATRRTVFLLAVSQALSMTGSSLVVTVSSLAGAYLAEDKSLATLPFALQYVGTMTATIPASLFMGRFGRRAGFTLGQSIGICGAALSAWALFHGMFWVFAAGSLMIGAHNAFWQYYRFAAADAADEAFRPRAISYVMTAGVVAAIAGPEIAKYSRDFFSPILFAGSYTAIIGLFATTIIILQFLRIPTPPPRRNDAPSGRPLLEIARNPVFVVAILSGMIGYAVMTLVMTATPLAMVACGFTFSDTAFVIQWHALAMFAPSFITGSLMRRFGTVRIILVGAMLNVICMGVNIAGIDFLNFWAGLVALGLGWNFMFIGGTTLLTETYRPEERAKVQATNDFLVFGSLAAASFSAGALQNAIGWDAVNAAIALPVLIAFSAAAWLRVKRRKIAAAT